MQFFEKNSVIANLLFYHITLHTYFFVFLLNEKGCGNSIFNEKTILKRLTTELISSLDDSLKLEVLEWAAFYEHRIAMGSKEIFHLEAFVAKYMAIYKKYLNDLFA